MSQKFTVSLFLTLMLLGSTMAVYAGTLDWEGFNDYLVSTADNNNDKREASVMRHPTDNTKLVSAYIDSAQTRCRTSNSSTGGTSWTTPAGSYLPLPTSTTVSYDPVLSVSGSTWYTICLALTDNMYGIGDVSKIFYNTSTDNGNTWSSATTVKTETCSSSTNCPLADKPSIVVSGTNVYTCWTRYDNHLTTTTTGVHIKFQRIGGSEINLADGTHSHISTVADRSVQGCNIAVSTGGIIYVAWSRLTSDTAGAMELRRSFDNGATFDSVQTIKTFTRTPTSVGSGQFQCNDEYGCVKGTTIGGTLTGFRVPNLPYLARDSSNQLHLAMMDYSSTTLTDIKYVKITGCTTQGIGCTFSLAVNVLNDGGLARDQFLPAIVFSGKTNTVHITASDRRADSSNVQFRPQHYHCHLDTTSCLTSSTWSTSIITTQASINYDGGNVGDYYSVTSNSAREAYDVFVDSRVNNLVQKYRIWSDRTTT